ncbi:Tetrathionate reductase subunit B [Labeo rohita]|uniref:Tetrathionate reductase subunit B n=1 Tax=Labeo rohita TaxID=84645 RepID=A0ABQ8LCH1_LABRO|nr:Tetrathionate reductase subunit B [Labeo rohita]
MYAKCREKGLRVRKEDVRMVLKELDSAGVSARRARRLRRRNYFAKGPNFIWHLDSYDKLKPYGVCINGCIDGFSRKIIWLNAYTTSSDPKLIGGYYIEAVKHLGGCPRVVRGDLGTENGYVRDFQRFLHISHADETLDSYLEGASTANQRIEYWWGVLRKECMEFWISLFADLRDNGFFDGGFLDKSLLQFCCMGLIQIWNAHTIRPSKNIGNPSGRPSVMYALPELYHTRDFLTSADTECVQLCQHECTFRRPIPCDPDVNELCNVIISESQLNIPRDPYQAVNLYMHLRDVIRALL